MIEKVKWARRNIKSRGAVSSIRHGLRLLNLNPTGYYYYFQIRQNIKHEPEDARPDPFKILWISPDRIQKVSLASFHKWRDAGQVCAGDWDQHVQSFSEMRVYQSLRQHFVGGLPWEETDIYLWSIDRIEQGKWGWQMCTTQSELDNRCSEVDELYNRMQHEGYLSWQNLTGRDIESVLKSRGFGTHKTDIAVHIDRNGEFLFVDGRHRLAIAKLLDIETVAVRVVVRHREWQAQREAAACNCENKTVMDDPNHEDLQTVLNN